MLIRADGEADCGGEGTRLNCRLAHRKVSITMQHCNIVLQSGYKTCYRLRCRLTTELPILCMQKIGLQGIRGTDKPPALEEKQVASFLSLPEAPKGRSTSKVLIRELTL